MRGIYDFIHFGGNESYAWKSHPRVKGEGVIDCGISLRNSVEWGEERSLGVVGTTPPGQERDVPAPPRRVALWSGPFGWMVPTVGCVGTVAHIL